MPGSLAALAGSESSYGTNLGTIGNVFQVLPSTASSPGYGLSSVNGNDPMSVGAFFSSILYGPAQGNYAQAYAIYQGGQGNPTNYPAGGPVDAWLSQNGFNPSPAGSSNVGAGASQGSAIDPIDYSTAGGNPSSLGTGNNSASGQNNSGNNSSSSWLSTFLGWLSGGFVLRLGVAFIAFVLLIIGLAALALHNDPVSVVKTAAKASVE